jgi:hypothetical protein
VIRRLAYPDTPGRIVSRWRQGQFEVASLLAKTTKDIQTLLSQSLSGTTMILPLSFMDVISIHLYLPAITTNYRADSLSWSDVTHFISDEFKKCKASAFDVEIGARWFKEGADKVVGQFYKKSELITLLRLKFWRRMGEHEYTPAPLYVSTYEHPRPFDPLYRRDRSPTRYK